LQRPSFATMPSLVFWRPMPLGYPADQDPFAVKIRAIVATSELSRGLLNTV
jgi:hypothetical protein